MDTSLTIEKLLDAKEGEHFQFKEAKRRFDFEDAAKCCCALANCGGGKLVFGITDQRPRSIVGSLAFEQPERTRKRLIDELHIMIDFQILYSDNKRILVFEVPDRPIGLPIQYKGIAWWYEGDSLIPMSENIRRKIYQEAGFDFSSSICGGAKLSDLDISSIEAFRSAWIMKSQNKRISSLSIEQLLRDCEAITDEGITYAALVLFGTHEALGRLLPQAEIIFEYRSSESSGPANQREEFRVGFFASYDRIWELINLRNDKQHYQDGFFVYDINTFNERVVREAVLNAVSHRNYQIGGSVFIRQYRDYLTIESPGGFPNGISLNNILDRQLPRNRRIAEILSLCGLVERSGQGMNLMYELSIKEAKELPDFTGTDDNFVCIRLNGMVIDEKMLSLIKRIGDEKLETLSTSDLLVINELYHGRKLSSSLQLRLKRLVELGIVEHVSRNKYVLARSLYSIIGKSGVHTRIVGLDRDTNLELIFKHIKESGKNGTPLNELLQVLPSHSRGQIQSLLRQLRKEGRVYVIGKTRGSKWYASR